MSTQALRSLRGREVDVDVRLRGRLHGLLLSTSVHSLWLVLGDDDVIVDLAEVESVRAA